MRFLKLFVSLSLIFFLVGDTPKEAPALSNQKIAGGRE